MVPTIHNCCRKLLQIKPTYATIQVYELEYTTIARSYHSRCKCTYYHGYKESAAGVRIFDISESKLLVFNSGSAFSLNLLKYMDSIICVGGVSFGKAAHIYNSVTNNNCLNQDRLQTAWFVYRILQYSNVFASWPRKFKSKELDVEQLCKNVYVGIKVKIDSKWMSHVCEEIGCKNRVIIIDGNEKLYRYVCASRRIHVKGNVGEVNSYKMCIRNPTQGNQSVQSSKFCSTHSDSKSGYTDEQLDLRLRTRQYAVSVPSTITSEEGCKKAAAIDKFFSRTAGKFYIFRSCGIRLSHTEMFTCESLSDVFVKLIDVFRKEPQNKDLRAIVYDRACDLRPFLQRLSNECATSYGNLDYIVDSFHVEGHTQNKCQITHSDCLYHPLIPKFHRGMNTDIAEQSFINLNG